MNTAIKQFYTRVLGTVSRVVGIPDIFTSNKEELVDARAILVCILSERGFTDTQIAMLTSLSRQGVNKLKNSVRFRRKKFSFHADLQQIRNELQE